MSIKKERQEWTYATTDGEVDSLTIVYNGKDNSIELIEADPKSIKSVVSYKRDSGKDKVVSSVPSGIKSCPMTPFDALKRSFDHICAIDTNTKVINGTRVSACSIYTVPNVLSSYKATTPFTHAKSYIICNVNPKINPEIIGWHIYFKDLFNREYFSKTRRSLGVVVDSELGAHDDINKREKPYYLDYKLPFDTKLIYGSSDTGKEYLPNAMMSLCDSASEMIIEYIIENKIALPKVSNGDANYDGYFFVKSNTPDPTIDIKYFNLKK